MNRTAIIAANGTLLRVVFTSDLLAETIKNETTVDCPDDYPKLVDWDVATRSWLPPPPPPVKPAPALHQLLDILVTGKLPTAEQVAALKLLPTERTIDARQD